MDGFMFLWLILAVGEQLCGDEIGTELSKQHFFELEAFVSSALLFVNSSKASIRTFCRGKYVICRVCICDYWICTDSILLITGHPHNLSNVSEIVAYSRNQEKWDCEDVPSLPTNIAGSTGGSFEDGTAIVCGGYQGFLLNFESTCYLIHPGEKEWRERQMTVARYFAASLVVNGISLIVSGGYQRKDAKYLPANI